MNPIHLTHGVFVMTILAASQPMVFAQEKKGLEHLAGHGCLIFREMPDGIAVTIHEPVAKRELAKLKSLDKLRTLEISYEAMTSGDVRQFPKLPSVTSLRVAAGKEVQDSFVDRLPDLFPQLETLVLNGAHLSAKGVLPVGKFRSLRNLLLVDVRHLPADIFDEIGKMPHLRQLSISKAGALADLAIEGLSASKSLEDLSLLQTGNIGDAHLQSIGKIKSLKRLKIENSSASLKGVAALKDLNALADLDIACHADESALGILGAMPSLRTLTLHLGNQTNRKGYLKLLGVLVNVESYSDSKDVHDDEVAAYLAMPKVQHLGFGISSLSTRGVAEFFRSGRIKSLAFTSRSIHPDRYPALKQQFPGLHIIPAKEFREK